MTTEPTSLNQAVTNLVGALVDITDLRQMADGLRLIAAIIPASVDIDNPIALPSLEMTTVWTSLADLAEAVLNYPTEGDSDGHPS